MQFYVSSIKLQMENSCSKIIYLIFISYHYVEILYTYLLIEFYINIVILYFLMILQILNLL